MILHSAPVSFDFTRSRPALLPCNNFIATAFVPSTPKFTLLPLSKRRKNSVLACFGHKRIRRRLCFCACSIPSDGVGRKLSAEFSSSARQGARNFVVKRISNELDADELQQESSIQLGSKFSSFQEDPFVNKLRTQLGVLHPIPTPPLNRNIIGLFVFFFFVGVVFDKLWTWRKRKSGNDESVRGVWPQVPTSFSLFLEKDLLRKESVEWVNMVLGKLWKVYRGGIENWIIGLLQPVIDNLQKPDYVQRVEIKQFNLGDEPLSVRNVERRTSRRVNDLQYQIGLRYTGGARMLLLLTLKFGIVPIVVPFGVRNFDIDGELWVKLRLIPNEPWVGAVSWAFVSLPKIKFDLSPFRLFNLMAIPVLSMFLTKLLTKDLPKLFVRPKKIVLDFQKGMAVGPVAIDLKSGEVQDGNKDFVGELSVTLVDAREIPYFFYGKTDPYVILSLGDQKIRSKKNSQTTVIGPPGEPIWNQDFHMLVANPRREKLCIQVKDFVGFTDLTIGTGEVDLVSLQDTVPTDRIVELRGGWGLLRQVSSGEILLRLTYKAYVEDEEDDRAAAKEDIDLDVSDDELFDSDDSIASYDHQPRRDSAKETVKESFMDVLAALIVSEEFQGIVSSDTGNGRLANDDVSGTSSAKDRSSTVKPESKPAVSDVKSEAFDGNFYLLKRVVDTCQSLIDAKLDYRICVVLVSGDYKYECAYCYQYRRFKYLQSLKLHNYFFPALPSMLSGLYVEKSVQIAAYEF